MVSSMRVVGYKGGKFQLSRRIRLGTRRRLPDFNSSAYANSKARAFRRKSKSRHTVPEGEVVQGQSAMEVGQDSVAILANGQEQVTTRG